MTITQHAEIAAARRALRDFVLELNPGLDPVELADNTPLIARRLVTSQHILDLLLLVEGLRLAPIDPRSLTPTAFADIDSIVDQVLLAGAR